MISSKSNTSFRWNADWTIKPLLAATAATAALIILLVVLFLLREAWPVLSDGGWTKFVLDESWYPLEGRFGLAPMVCATLAASAGAVLLAAPLGVGSAIFGHFYATPMLKKLYGMTMALLAGIPSVVYGLWGLTVLVPLIARIESPGSSLLAAILVLALMILPTVALTSASALEAVPGSLMRGAAALGMTFKGQILGVAVPAARVGIVGGILLALARAMGETMAVLMVAGNIVQMPLSIFEPVRVLTANIALEMGYATGTHRAGLFASGLLLTALVLLLAFIATRIAGKARHD
jgi:phosphate transport system permease protein